MIATFSFDIVVLWIWSPLWLKTKIPLKKKTLVRSGTPETWRLSRATTPICKWRWRGETWDGNNTKTTFSSLCRFSACLHSSRAAGIKRRSASLSLSLSLRFDHVYLCTTCPLRFSGDDHGNIIVFFSPWCMYVVFLFHQTLRALIV